MAKHNQKIIWMIDSLRPGGAEQLMVPILKNLKELFDIRVCTLQVREGNPIGKQLEELNIPVDLVEIPNLKSPQNLPSIIRYLKKHSPDLIHTQLQFADILGSTAGKRLGIPTLSTQHTIDSNTELSSAGIRQKMTWFCLKHFSKVVIAVSNQTKRYHVQTGNLPPSKILTVHNGIDIEKFSTVPEEARNKIRETHRIPLDANVILTIAVLREKKGIQYLIQALPEILKHHPNTVQLIVGDGEYRSHLENLVRENDLSNHIIFTGHKTNIPEYLSASDIFVLPTLIDAFPTVLLEAMAATKPIIASNVGGIPEIIEDKFSGLLTEPQQPNQLANEITTLLSIPNQAEALANNGHQTVLEKFSIQQQVERLEKIYLGILNE